MSNHNVVEWGVSQMGEHYWGFKSRREAEESAAADNVEMEEECGHSYGDGASGVVCRIGDYVFTAREWDDWARAEYESRTRVVA